MLTQASRGIGGGGYGQNLAMWGSTNNPEAFGATGSVARAASNGWYNGELNDFPSSDYGKDSPNMANFSKWGHYSQLIWKETKKVGCATHFCPAGTMYDNMGSWYTVCNYYPAGMFSAAKPNLSPPLIVLQAIWAAPTARTWSLPRARPWLLRLRSKLGNPDSHLSKHDSF